MIRGVLILNLCLFYISSVAQTFEIIKNVKGEGRWEIVGDVSPKQAEERALLEAKKDALRRAGIATEVRSLNFTSIIDGEETIYSEKFTQLNSIMLGGLVRLIRPINISKEHIHTGNDEMVVTIETDVIKDAKPDPEFIIELSGIFPIYRSGEKLTFTLKPYKDCYIRVFLFDKIDSGEGFVIYPLDKYNNDICFKHQQSYSFPLNKELESNKRSVNYVLENTSGKLQDENIIFVVALRKQIPYIQSVTFEHFFEWYYNIPADIRSEIYANTIIIK